MDSSILVSPRLIAESIRAMFEGEGGSGGVPTSPNGSCRTIGFASAQQELDGRKRAWRLKPDQEQHLRLTKFQHWEYEQEKRLFVDLSNAVKEGPLHFRKFDDDLKLVEVILGFACDLPLEDLRASVSAHYIGVVTFKARLGVHNFEIVRDEATVP